jgi:hypothetical protein
MRTHSFLHIHSYCVYVFTCTHVHKNTTSGEYTASYNATAAGSYTLTVTLAGTVIGGGPIVVRVAPARAHAATTTCDNCYQVPLQHLNIQYT